MSRDVPNRKQPLHLCHDMGSQGYPMKWPVETKPFWNRRLNRRILFVFVCKCALAMILVWCRKSGEGEKMGAAWSSTNQGQGELYKMNCSEQSLCLWFTSQIDQSQFHCRFWLVANSHHSPDVIHPSNVCSWGMLFHHVSSCLLSEPSNTQKDDSHSQLHANKLAQSSISDTTYSATKQSWAKTRLQTKVIPTEVSDSDGFRRSQTFCMWNLVSAVAASMPWPQAARRVRRKKWRRCVRAAPFCNSNSHCLHNHHTLSFLLRMSTCVSMNLEWALHRPAREQSLRKRRTRKKRKTKRTRRTRNPRSCLVSNPRIPAERATFSSLSLTHGLKLIKITGIYRDMLYWWSDPYEHNSVTDV